MIVLIILAGVSFVMALLLLIVFIAISRHTLLGAKKDVAAVNKELDEHDYVLMTGNGLSFRITAPWTLRKQTGEEVCRIKRSRWLKYKFECVDNQGQRLTLHLRARFKNVPITTTSGEVVAKVSFPLVSLSRPENYQLSDTATNLIMHMNYVEKITEQYPTYSLEVDESQPILKIVARRPSTLFTIDVERQTNIDMRAVALFLVAFTFAINPYLDYSP